MKIVNVKSLENAKSYSTLVYNNQVVHPYAVKYPDETILIKCTLHLFLIIVR